MEPSCKSVLEMIINKLKRLTEDQIKDLQSLMCELSSNVTISTDMLRRTV